MLRALNRVLTKFMEGTLESGRLLEENVRLRRELHEAHQRLAAYAEEDAQEFANGTGDGAFIHRKIAMTRVENLKALAAKLLGTLTVEMASGWSSSESQMLVRTGRAIIKDEVDGLG